MKIEYKKYASCKTNKASQVHNLILTFLCCFFGFNLSAYAQSADIQFSRDSQNLILSFAETHGLIADEDNGTTLKVYGNGLVKVHYPIHMKRAGDYQMQLDDDSLNELLQTLAEKNIPEFDLKEVQSVKNNIIVKKSQLSTPELFAVFDASTTTIELNFDRYTKQATIQTNSSKANDEILTESGHDIFNLKQKISWEGLRTDSKRFPNIEAIQNLATAQQLLLDMAESNQLIRSK